jgi:putative tributyrin esterase
MAVIQGQFFSKCLKRQTQFTALLPVERLEIPGMPAPDRSAPKKTLYLLHGYSGSHTDWLYGSRIQELALMFGLYVVMPSCGNTFYLDQADREEYYGEYIGHELPDFAQEAFGLPDDLENRYLGGLSMGGFGALRNGIKYGDRFSSVMALSSALINQRLPTLKPGQKDAIATYEYYKSVFGDLSALPESENSPEVLVSRSLMGKSRIPRIYMACGSDDFLIEENRRFHSFLSEKGVAHEYVEGPGVHDWKFWDEYAEKGIRWMLSR